MAADNYTGILNLQYTPPSAPASSGVAALTVAGTNNGGQSGSVDVPPSTVVGAVFPIPFGSVGAAKMLVIRNNMTSEVGVRLNGAVSNNFNLPAGGIFAYIAPLAPNAVPITSASIVTTVDPTVIERVAFWSLGD